jgi:hypothetical protein
MRRKKTVCMIQAYLDEEKPAFKIQFLNSNFDNEYLWVSIDFYSGLFSIYMSNTPPSKTKTMMTLTMKRLLIFNLTYNNQKRFQHFEFD